jgi:hypothetical protein
MHVAFAGLAQRYQAVSERAAALEAKVRPNMFRISALISPLECGAEGAGGCAGFGDGGGGA